MKPENGQKAARKNQNHWALTFSGFFLAVFWLLVGSSRAARAQTDAPERLDRGRFTAVFYPSERALATSLLDGAAQNDTFPGLPRPRQQVLIAFAPDRAKFHEWAGP